MKLLLLGFVVCATLLVENVSAKPGESVEILGGFSPVSADSDTIKQLAVFSLTSVAQQSGSKRSLGLIRVVSAQSQVVAGTNYEMALLVCEKNSANTDDTNVDQKACRKCDITLWEQLWLNKKNVTKVACTEPAELSSFSDVTNNGVSGQQ